jgi:mRNA interferase MazF
MLRGEIRIVDLGPGLPGEEPRRRPAVIVSNNGANATAGRLGRGVLTVVPMTSNVDCVYPFQTLVPADTSGLEQDSNRTRKTKPNRSVGCLSTVSGNGSDMLQPPPCSRSTMRCGYTSNSDRPN